MSDTPAEQGSSGRATRPVAWAPLGRRRALARGMTLIEVLIAVALIALLTGSIVFGSGMLSSSRQRGAATLVVSAVRTALTTANTSGRAVRIVFDLENQRLWLEQSSSGRMLREKPGTTEDTAAGAAAATETEALAQKEAERILEGPKAARPDFQRLGKTGEEGRDLGAGIVFRQVQTQHDEEPVTSGRAYLYFWPGGETERAAIQVQRKGVTNDEDALTVMVSPLTGRANIVRGRENLPEPRFSDEEYSEREEP